MNERRCCVCCGRSQGEVKRLLTGPVIFMCDECVETMNAKLRGSETDKDSRLREEVERAVHEGFKRIVANLDLGPLHEKYQRLIKVKFREEEPGGPAFEDVFEEFKRGVEEVISPDDYQSRYDLGIAYHEMELEQDAFREFSSSLRHALQKSDFEMAKEIMSAMLYIKFPSEKVMDTIRNTFQQLG
jgi:hypothetical protein